MEFVRLGDLADEGLIVEKSGTSSKASIGAWWNSLIVLGAVVRKYLKPHEFLTWGAGDLALASVNPRSTRTHFRAWVSVIHFDGVEQSTKTIKFTSKGFKTKHDSAGFGYQAEFSSERKATY